MDSKSKKQANSELTVRSTSLRLLGLKYRNNRNRSSMRYLAALILATFATNTEVRARSTLLESVKSNPEEAISLCKKFRSTNSKGFSAISETSIKEIAAQKNLSIGDAEILSMYVIGLNCPDVR